MQEKDYFAVTEQIAENLVNDYDYSDPEELDYELEDYLAEEIEREVSTKWDAYEIIMSAEIQSWNDVIDDYGYELTSIYGLASWAIARLFYDNYYSDVVKRIMDNNGWTDSIE